ncbi:ABC transporter permease [Paenibacillus sp. GCM10027626]|uniref:ABC transporter permease n=1 Tax=Paenibacillus sp. GCM10027626 TaxID=3273411 RepID=UPI003627B739
MGRILLVEAAKLRHSKLLWLTILGIMLPSLVSTIMVLASKDPYSWQAWYHTNLQFQVMLMAPPLFSIFTGYLVAREYQDKTINTLFSYPYARTSFYLGKMLIVAATIIGMLLLTYAINGGLGLFLMESALSISEWLVYLKIYTAVGILFVALIPLWMYVSMISRSIIPAIVIGIIIIMIPGPVGGSAAYRDTIGLIRRMVTGEGAQNELAVVSGFLFACFVVFLTLSLHYYNKADVHSGS